MRLQPLRAVGGLAAAACLACATGPPTDIAEWSATHYADAGTKPWYHYADPMPDELPTMHDSWFVMTKGEGEMLILSASWDSPAPITDTGRHVQIWLRANKPLEVGDSQQVRLAARATALLHGRRRPPNQPGHLRDRHPCLGDRDHVHNRREREGGSLPRRGAKALTHTS